MNANHVGKLILSCAFALGILAFTPPAFAQGASRADLRSDVRQIEQEYARQNGGRGISDDQLEYYLDRARAGWSMQHISQDMAQGRRNAPNSQWRAQQGWTATAVVCSSIDNRYRECAVPFRGSAVMEQQISDSNCIEGQSWGQKQGMVWVNRGCRARFVMVRDVATAPVAGRPGIVCKSHQGRRNVCNTGMNGNVRLLNRFKNSGACIEGRTWGQRGNQVWVSDNCRARFVQANYRRGDRDDRRGDRDDRRDDRDDRRDDNRGWNRDANYSATCSSDGGPQRCNWDARYGSPRLVQRLSQAGCVEGRSWGYTLRDGLWTNGGCRARFAAR